MEFRILGSFEVVGSAGVLDLRGAKRRGLLACLVVHAGRPMSTDRLVEELWGAGGSEAAVRTVQTYVSQLRKLLRGEAAKLVTSPGGYVLEVDPAALDAWRFEQGLTAASAETDPTRRLALLDGGLALWRGPPLDEFGGAGWADREAMRLEARHLDALRRRYETLLVLGRAGDAVAEHETLVRVHPLDEGLWAHLMLALYRGGRQADALAAYQRARRHLVEELGIEPGRELAELEHRILGHDPTLGVPTEQSAMRRIQHASAAGGGEGWYPRTFVLTDIVDSVSLWERDPAAMSDAVARHDSLIRDAVRAGGGELVRTKGEGDSTFSVFRPPWDAVAAAAAIHEAVGTEPWPSATPLCVRAGVHTGDAEPRDGDWYGQAVNRAARLRALAGGGQTLLSGVTAGLVADQTPKGLRLFYRGRRVLRGIERPEDVWELVAADDPDVAAPWPVTSADLPLALTSFVGRTAELEALAQLVEGERLVTLTGPGGSGKTRLALELANRAARQGKVVWLAELAPLSDGGLVAQVVATAVGIETGPEPVDDLLARPELLGGLLVLDNCEHVVDACAAFTTAVLAAAPELHVLATSREPLNVAGEREWPVGPLDVPDEALPDPDQLARVESVQLLLDRARSVRPTVELTSDDVAAVARICRTLDGIPLAIELAAGRLRSLSLTDLSEHLTDQLSVLTGHRSAGPDATRHRTLRTTLDWSYELLTDQQRALAQRLSVFAGGFRLDAVEAVCGSDFDVLDGVDELVAKSWVTFDGVTARYRLLEPIRQYLGDHFEAADAAETVRRAHAAWVASLCDRMGTRILEDQRVRSRRLGEESSNIEEGLRWAQEHDPAIVASIVGSLGQYWMFYDQASGRRWCDRAIEIAPAVPPRRWAKVLLSAGMIAQNDHAWDRSVARLREALAIYRAEQATAGQAASLQWLGRALSNLADAEESGEHAVEATRCFEEGLRLSIERGDSVGAGWFRLWLCARAFWDGDLELSERLANQVIEDCNAAGVRHPVGQALCNLGFIAHWRGRDDAALEFLHDAVALFRDLDDRWQLADLLIDVAVQEAAVGRGAEGLQALAESVRLERQVGRRPWRSFRLAVAAVVHLARGQPTMAVGAMGAFLAHRPESMNWARPLRSGGHIGWAAAPVQTTRAQLNPVEVDAATAAARSKALDDLMDELIIQPAMEAA